MLISLAIGEQMKSPIFMAQLKSVRRKLIASFSPALKSKVDGLKARIRIGEPVSASVLTSASPPSQKVVRELHQAFLLRHRVSISYRAVNGRDTDRVIEPHYLLLCHPVWYVLAWDKMREDVRTFRCDRIVGTGICDDGAFRLLPIARFEKALEGLNAI